MEYIDFSGHGGSQDDDLSSAPSVQHYNPLSSSYTHDQPNASYMNPNYPAPISCDIKPRLTKEQHDILESHYQKQSKPNTNIKKGFAESLNVSLDKVNNWFQNRRAKSKQDAKKHAGTLNIFQGHQRTGSDSDTSPVFVNPSSNYHAFMQQWAAERGLTQGLGISSVQQTQQQQQLQIYAGQNNQAEAEPLESYLAPVQFNGDGQEDMKRITLTQEQFSAMERNGGMLDPLGNFEGFGSSFFGDQDVMNTMFPGYNLDLKQEEIFAYPIGAPLSSYDSTAPSNVSEQSLQAFPATSDTQPQANVSPVSDWTDSRSSSIHEGAATQVPPSHQTPVTTSQWQPGQSIPVDPTAQYETFQQVAAQAAQARSATMHEQTATWPHDDLRRASTTSLLAHSMSNVGIHTPAQHQAATFKSPAPASNIAARRSRARPPPALGLHALRSQSHTGLPQPGSPVTTPQAAPGSADPSLRRIRSSNYLGSIATGRVMKPTPGSARISPMHYTFADAVNSPHAVRHASQTNLAPPTPLSPKESAGVEHAGAIQQWQNASQAGSRQGSMHESDTERGIYYHPSVVQLGQHRASPPHTPMSHQHQFAPPRIHPNAVMENTPPQSAPASQTCFPSSIYPTAYPAHPQMHHQPVPSQPPMAHPMHAVAMHHSHPQQFVHTIGPEQHFQQSNVIFTPNQQANITTTGPPPGVPIQFSNGVPITNADGNIELVFPPQLQFVHQHQTHGHTPPQHMHTPPQGSYSFGASTRGSPISQAVAQLSKASSDFFVHEYSPPEAVKRGATPRRGPVDTAPKNYAFANTGPEHFEEKKGDDKKARKVDSKDSGLFTSSPASSSGTAHTT